MAEKIELIKEKVTHNGLVDFTALYNYAYSWLKDEENYGVSETRYNEKVSGNARDIDIEWNAYKNVSDYFSIDFKIKWEIRGLAEVEVEIDGKKKKMNKGSVAVEVKGHLIRDRKSEWDASPFYRFIREVYNKYIVPTRVDILEDKVKDDVRKFVEVLKSIFEVIGRR